MKLTVTGVVLVHPATLRDGLTPALGGFGGVLSIFTVTRVAALILPATSVQVPLTTVPAVSPAKTLADEQLKEPGLYHPAALGAGSGR